MEFPQKEFEAWFVSTKEIETDLAFEAGYRAALLKAARMASARGGAATRGVSQGRDVSACSVARETVLLDLAADLRKLAKGE